MEQFKQEIKEKKRFQFGKNWKSFLRNLDYQKIENSKISLLNFLELSNLNGKTFLDVGSGSGLSSLSAINSGAKVFSFDFDTQSVECTKFIKDKYFNGKSDDWVVEQGSALDENYLNSLPKFDIVYSWGVLHHTGNMWKGLELVQNKVRDNGLLYIAIYNDQGYKSRIWKRIKSFYISNSVLRPFLIYIFTLYFWGPKFIYDLFRLKPFKSWKDYKIRRGMSPYFDVIDWIGGYPFEYAKPEEIIKYFRSLNFTLLNLKTCGGKLGCNEFVFKKN